MNKVELIGRIVREPDVRYTQGAAPMCVARYTLAVERRIKKEGENNADFISCVAFSKSAEFTEKYFKKGMKVAVVGRIQTGSYKDKDGKTVWTTDVIVEEQEFCESKKEENTNNYAQSQQTDAHGFMNIPDGIEEELPFM